MKPKWIRVIAICLFRHQDSILVFESFDRIKGTPFYRPLGGGVEPGETSTEAIRREIREELSQEITDLRLLTPLESLFIYDGKPYHEIVFVYDARFVDPSVYAAESLQVVEDNGEVVEARWRAINWFDDYHRLVPEALVSLLDE